MSCLVLIPKEAITGFRYQLNPGNTRHMESWSWPRRLLSQCMINMPSSLILGEIYSSQREDLHSSGAVESVHVPSKVVYCAVEGKIDAGRRKVDSNCIRRHVRSQKWRSKPMMIIFCMPWMKAVHRNSCCLSYPVP